ncbi:MAG: DMT family transporter [Alphaproteobacteria bacterium]|nr:MAG: DMT family transporter [Alphaproteobacteria bacterium]
MSSAAREVPAGRGKRHDPIACAAWMILSCALLAGLAAIGRYVTTSGVPPFQVVFLRVVFAVITLAPLLAARGRSFLHTDHWNVYAIRALTGSIAMLTWFSALSLISVGEVTAISFLAPLFATIGAALFLGETVRFRRWTATIIGFCGALVILRPGLVELSVGSWLAVASAVAMGVSTIFIKRLADGDDPDKVVFLSSCLQAPLTLLPALFVWQWPEPWLWPFLIAMGPVATLGHVTLTRAFAAADASFTMSFDFARLPFAVAFGYAVFGEIIDIWTWIGAAIIFAASLFIVHREAQLKKRMASVSVGPVSPRI